MAVKLPDGATIAMGTTVGASKTMSAITNASAAVATLEASHGFIATDIGIFTSGWSKLNGRVVRISAVSVNDVTLEGINTSNTTDYPAGSGTGSVVEVTAWTQITQVIEASFSGGEQQFTTYSFLEDSFERQLPTQKSAMSLTLQIGDDQSLAHYQPLLDADRDRTNKAIRISLPGGAKLYFPAVVTFNPNPTLTKGSVMTNQVTLSLQAEMVRYSS